MKSSWEKSEQNAVIAAIHEAKFVCNVNDEKNYLPNLYDGTNFFYCRFKSASELLHSRYTPLLLFLRRCGLKYQVTKNELWHFIDLLASKFVQVEHNMEDGDFEKMQKIVEEFQKSEYNQMDFDKLKVLSLFETERNGIKPLKECFDYHFLDVVEYVAPVLSKRFAEKVLTRTRSMLTSSSRVRTFWESERGVNFQPSTNLVFKNLTILSSSCPADPQKIFACLKYLCDRTTSLTQSIRKRLSSLPCIEVENCNAMLPPRQISKVLSCHCPDFETMNKCVLTEYLGTPSIQSYQLWNLLKTCGATDLFSLQQVIYVLEVFKNEFQGDIRDNPNMVPKYETLERHFSLFLEKCKSHDIDNLDSNQAVYLKSLGGSLVDISFCIFIDDHAFFRIVTSQVGNFERFIPDERILKNSYIKKTQLSKLPVLMRPKLFSDIAKVSIDSSTFSCENSSSQEFNLTAVLNKMRNERFHERCAYVLRSNLGDSLDFGGSSRIDWINLVTQMNRITLTPVKRLFLKCEFTINNSISDDSFTFEHYKIYKTGGETNPNIVLVYNQNQLSDQVLKDVVKKMLNQCKIHAVSFEKIDLIASLLFRASSEEDEKLLLLKAGVEIQPTPEEENYLAQKQRIGTTVPFSYHAIIEHDPRRSFRKDELVAIKVSQLGSEDIFNFGQFVCEESAADYSTDPITMARLKIIIDPQEIFETIDGSRIYGFKEKPDQVVNSVTSSNQGSNDKMEDDLKTMSGIIWNACRNCEDVESLRKNLNEINTRLVESVMHKYQSPEEQRTLKNSLTQMISLEIQKALAERRTREESNTIDRQSENRQEYSHCQEIVQNFVEQHFQRMTKEIEAYDNFQRRASCSIDWGFSNRRQRRRTYPSIESMIRNSVADTGPHPGLAQLWIKQASEDLETLNLHCNDANISQICNAWTFDMSMKVSYVTNQTSFKSNQDNFLARILHIMLRVY